MLFFVTCFYTNLQIMRNTLVEIKSPCKVNLDGMPQNESGRFCSVCSTTVVDFTDKTPEEISQYFLSHQGEHFCGAFNRQEVKTESRFYNSVSVLYSGKLKFVALFISGLLLLMGCKTRKYGRTAGVPVKMLDEKNEPIESIQ